MSSPTPRAKGHRLRRLIDRSIIRVVERSAHDGDQRIHNEPASDERRDTAKQILIHGVSFACATTVSHVLIDEDRVSIRVHRDEAGRPRRALVRLLLQLHALGLQLALQLADVGERGAASGRCCPSRG